MRFRICRQSCLALLLLMFSGGSRGQDIGAVGARAQSQVEVLRGLKFAQPVEHALQSPEDLQQVVQQELARSYPGETLRILEKRLFKFGFVASPIDLRAQLLRMYRQQIAGYYDPHTKQMVVIERRPGTRTSGGMLPIEWLSQWAAASVGLSLEEILLAHELTHAIQDQHFDLLSLPIEALDPEDTTAAVKALIEGDATLVMFDYMLAPQGTDAIAVPELSANLHAWVKSPLVRGVSMFQPVPRYLMDNLLFSYVAGFDFVLALKRQGGWERVNQAYQDFPVSTEQILHPEKYLDQRDLPTSITLPDLPDTFDAWRLLERNTLGEFNVSLLLDGYLLATKALIASRGWDGDRLALYEHAQSGALLAVWYTAWDSEVDSKEFFQAYAACLEKRYGADAPAGGALPPLPRPNIAQWTTPDGEVWLERHDRDVLLVDGAAAEDSEFLREHFWNSRIERRE